ncbi:MAG TPA: hypothetical protein VGE01_05450 [Fimbriimonas sp.]
MSKNEPTAAPTQAQITRRLIIRTSILLLVIAALIYAFQYYRSVRSDLGGRATSETAGLIAAIQYKKGGGQEAVLFKPDGSIIRNEGWKEGVVDRDIAWTPDGNFLFFISDRADNVFHVMRWSPGSGNVEARSIGSRGKSNPTFPVGDVPNASKSSLVTSGGVVFDFEPSKPSMLQVLPPTADEIVVTGMEEGGGSESQFQGYYGQLGQSFRIARWLNGKDWVAGVMKRDAGEILIIQNLVRREDGRLEPPRTITAGERVDFDVNPKTGGMVYSVVNFQWPDPERVPRQFVKGNRVTTPYRNMIGLVGTTEQETSGPVVVSNDDRTAFLSPRISPDGTTVLAVVGPYDRDSSSVQPQALVSMPAEVGGAQQIRRLAVGEVYEPSWSPNGAKIAFARRQDGRRTIFTIDRDGGSERNVSGDQGDFGWPLFSPQTQ